MVDAAPDLNLTNAEVGGVITGNQTQELPVNGRYWASLEALIPGAISAGTGTQDQIRFRGLSQEDNNFRFDGVDATGLNHEFVKVAARLSFLWSPSPNSKQAARPIAPTSAEWPEARSAWSRKAVPTIFMGPPMNIFVTAFSTPMRSIPQPLAIPHE